MHVEINGVPVMCYNFMSDVNLVRQQQQQQLYLTTESFSLNSALPRSRTYC